MDLQQLSTFCTIISEKNMTTTAQRLKVTQPTISRQIRLLENELGVELLERGDRILRPTVQGQLFFEYAQKILNLVHKAERAVQSLPAHLEGLIRVATINYLGMSLMAPVVCHFLRPGNQFKIHLSYASSIDEIIEKMKKKQVDAAILPHLREEYGIDFPYYESCPLFQDSMLFVGSKKDISLPNKISIKDMNKKPVVSFADMFPRFNLYLEEKKKERNVHLDPIFEVNNLGTLKKIIEVGQYWGFMPAFSIQKQIQSGRLSVVQMKEVDYSVGIHFYNLKNLKNKKLIEIILLMLKKQISFSASSYIQI